ncbi:MAG: DUF4625 domain-containing protein [Bacteroidales bacterium]|nr:DUF4625 domain-containing protein [Bacteroidales bacterium]
MPKAEIDEQKPEFLQSDNTFPQQCDTLYFGEYFVFNQLFIDNKQLGAYNIDVHQISIIIHTVLKSLNVNWAR